MLMLTANLLLVQCYVSSVYCIHYSQDITNGTTLEPEQILQQAIADGELTEAINSGVVSVTSTDQYTVNSLQVDSSLDCLPGYAADADLQECGMLKSY